MLYNKGTGNEVLELWNGIIACEWQEDYTRINILYRSGLPILIVDKVKIAEPKTIYDYESWED